MWAALSVRADGKSSKVLAHRLLRRP